MVKVFFKPTPALGKRLRMEIDPFHFGKGFDLSDQAMIDLQKRFGLSMLFISHDMQVIQRVSHRIAVMYFGKIVEMGPADEIYSRPQHAYSKALLAAAPRPDPSARRSRRARVPRELPLPD